MYISDIELQYNGKRINYYDIRIFLLIRNKYIVCIKYIYFNVPPSTKQ